jgi:hypothetical protein
MGTRTTSTLPLALWPLDWGKLRIGTGLRSYERHVGGGIVSGRDNHLWYWRWRAIGDNVQRRAEKTEHVIADKS